MYFIILKLRIHRVKNRVRLVDRKCIHSESIGLKTALFENIKDCKVIRGSKKTKNSIGKNNGNNKNNKNNNRIK